MKAIIWNSSEDFRWKRLLDQCIPIRPFSINDTFMSLIIVIHETNSSRPDGKADTWGFDGGIDVNLSSSAHVVPILMSEKAFVVSFRRE
jgi:hypothetical protein